MCVRRCGLGCLPFVLLFLSVSTFVITYAISVYKTDVNPWFPTISQTADHTPESNVFGLLFNICAFLCAVTMFVRYLQIRHDTDWNEPDRPVLLKLNRAAIALGLLASFGASLVANFQDNNVTIVHMIGALMVFVCGILYCGVQALITYKMKNCGLNTGALLSIRLFFFLLMTIFFILFFATMAAAGKSPLSKHKEQNATQTTQWNKDDKGYISHVASDVSEWLMVLCLLGFISTFFGEFKSVRMKIVVSRNSRRTVPLAISGDESLSTAPLLL